MPRKRHTQQSSAYQRYLRRREEWSNEAYINFAVSRLRSILANILNGRSPTGQINLFSELPEVTQYPRVHVCKSVLMKYEREWQQLLREAEKHYDLAPVLQYTFYCEYRMVFAATETTPERGTIVAVFAPPRPDTDQRVFEP